MPLKHSKEGSNINGTDEWTGPATEGKDPRPESSTFGKCTVVDSKCCITSDAVPTSGLGLGTEAAKPVLGVDLAIPGSSGYDAPKPSGMAPAGADPTSADAMNQDDVK